MRFASNYDTTMTTTTWWSDNTISNLNQVSESFKKVKAEIEKLTKALKLFNRRTLPPPSPWTAPAVLALSSQIPATTLAVRRSPNWRGHTGWVRLGSGRPL